MAATKNIPKDFKTLVGLFLKAIVDSWMALDSLQCRRTTCDSESNFYKQLSKHTVHMIVALFSHSLREK